MNENLYEAVKNRICDDIFAGRYEDGDRLPPERELEESLGVSRVTIRKSLEILEQDGLIVREVGRGTRLTLQNCGHADELDMIVLIAPARNPFFSEFIARFQAYAQTKDSLLLYVEKPEKESLEKCLYRLYRRGLRNAVIWLEDLEADSEKLKRLRALGMNMVFFDSDRGMPYADCVALDNEKAIYQLHEKLRSIGYNQIGYLSWDREDIYSIGQREKAYRDCTKTQNKKTVLKLSWKRKIELEEILKQMQESNLDAMICSDRECGELAVRAIRLVQEQGIEAVNTIQLATVDELGDSEKEGVIMCRQNLEQIVEQIYTCLQMQCENPGQWTAREYKMQGQLLE